MALWTPAQLTSYCWIDFSDTTKLFDATSGGSNVTSGTGIARAEDKSGNGRHFTQSTAGSRPTYTSNRQNGLGAAVYDGGDWLTSSSAASVWKLLHSTTTTVFVVVKSGTTANPIAIYAWYGTDAGSSANTGASAFYDDRATITGQTDSFLGRVGRGVVNTLAVSSVNLGAVPQNVNTDFRSILTPNTFQFCAIRMAPGAATAADRLKIAVNGGTLVGNQAETSALSTSDPTFTLQLGSSGNGGSLLTGDYSEFLVFDSQLSTTNQQLVEGYLAWKWGLQGNLPAGHPYKNAAPSIGSFDEGGMFGGISGGMTGGFAT